jgi:glycosyltransferase involved in cell wall biosynthesis
MVLDQHPRISVVIPSYNQAEFLEAAITSVLGQDYPNTELMVLDGGSSDGSAQIIRRYESSIARWRSRRDEGQASAIAEGLAASTGEILCYLNSDDMYLPGAFARVAAAFSGCGDRPRWIIGGNVRIDGAGEVTRFDKPVRVSQRRLLSWGSGFVQPAAFWNRAIYEAAAPVDPRFGFCMDFDLFVRMAGIAKPRIIPAYVAAFRDHEQSKSATLREVERRELDQIRGRYLTPGSSLTHAGRGLLRMGYTLSWKVNRARTLAGRPPELPATWPCSAPHRREPSS